MPDYADVVDLDRYAIHELDSHAGRELVARCRAELAELGACTLPGFLTPAAVARMIEIADDLADKAWPSDQTHTIYFTPVDSSFAPSHPLAHTVRSAKHGIAYDFIPADAPLRRLYESDDLTRFVAAALDEDVLYRSADPLDALQITRFGPGEELGWHFDNSEFSVTVMYQPAERGGEFVYRPRLRTADDDNYAEVERVLAGDPTGLITLPSGPGTFALFRGHHAAHRVTPVEGDRPRINSVLTYGDRPDTRLSDLTSKLFYGRTTTASAPR